jgi:hypothetical protein
MCSRLFDAARHLHVFYLLRRLARRAVVVVVFV